MRARSQRPSGVNTDVRAIEDFREWLEYEVERVDWFNSDSVFDVCNEVMNFLVEAGVPGAPEWREL